MPETDYQTVNIPVYGLGETLAVEQETVSNPGPFYFLNSHENKWINDLREIGHKAANSNLKLDFGLDNFGLEDGQLVFYDIQDEESVWTNEELSLHLMGNYLEHSIDRLKREADLRAPETREMAESWKQVK